MAGGAEVSGTSLLKGAQPLNRPATRIPRNSQIGFMSSGLWGARISQAMLHSLQTDVKIPRFGARAVWLNPG